MARSWTVNADPFITDGWHPLGNIHTWTDWIFRDIDTNLVVHESPWDEVNLLSYVTPAIFDEDGNYQAEVVFGDDMGFQSPVAIIPLEDEIEIIIEEPSPCETLIPVFVNDSNIGYSPIYAGEGCGQVFALEEEDLEVIPIYRPCS